jgi:hypothetical protein
MYMTTMRALCINMAEKGIVYIWRGSSENAAAGNKFRGASKKFRGAGNKFRDQLPGTYIQDGGYFDYKKFCNYSVKYCLILWKLSEL